MKRYYYHGVSDLLDEISLDIMSKIIETKKIKTRKEIGNMSAEYDHVCLYKKNEKIDYSKKENYYRSARSGWIDHCFVFIINPNIKAVVERKKENTNLIDEWRSIGSINIDMINGIAIPFDSIATMKERNILSNSFFNKLDKLIDYCKKNNWLLANSDEENFCDNLDNLLNQK